MLLKSKNFYVFSYNGGGKLKGRKEDDLTNNESVDIVFYHNGEDIETHVECRLCTELEKEYWCDSMNFIDKEIPNEDYGAVSLCDFEDWKIEKGYID